MSGNTAIVIETSMGTIQAELWADKAPDTVANFLRYADEGHYDGLIFHRVIDGFMVQGGGMTPDMADAPVTNPSRMKRRQSGSTPEARWRWRGPVTSTAPRRSSSST